MMRSLRRGRRPGSGSSALLGRRRSRWRRGPRRAGASGRGAGARRRRCRRPRRASASARRVTSSGCPRRPRLDDAVGQRAAARRSGPGSASSVSARAGSPSSARWSDELAQGAGEAAGATRPEVPQVPAQLDERLLHGLTGQRGVAPADGGVGGVAGDHERLHRAVVQPVGLVLEVGLGVPARALLGEGEPPGQGASTAAAARSSGQLVRQGAGHDAGSRAHAPAAPGRRPSCPRTARRVRRPRRDRPRAAGLRRKRAERRSGAPAPSASSSHRALEAGAVGEQPGRAAQQDAGVGNDWRPRTPAAPQLLQHGLWLESSAQLPLDVSVCRRSRIQTGSDAAFHPHG